MDVMTASLFLDQLDALDVDLPADAANAKAVYRAAMATAARQPTNDLLAALEAGELTADNVGDRVRQAAAETTAQQAAHAIVQDLQNALYRVIRTSLRASEPHIHADLARRFAPAATGVMQASELFGPETTAGEVLTMDPDVVAVWQTLEGHTRTLDAVSSTYRTYLLQYAGGLPHQLVTLFVAGPVDLDQAEQVYRQHQPQPWLALAAAGYRLNLNSRTEAAELVAAHRAAKEREARAEKDARAEEYRRGWSFPVGAA